LTKNWLDRDKKQGEQIAGDLGRKNLVTLNWKKCFHKAGVDVMITIFCDFLQFSAEKWRFSLKPML
jgi:hypothetical protein